MIEKFKTSLKVTLNDFNIIESKTSSGKSIYSLTFTDEKYGRISVKILREDFLKELIELSNNKNKIEQVTLGFYGSPYVDDGSCRPALLTIGIILKSEDDIFKVIEVKHKPEIIYEHVNYLTPDNDLEPLKNVG